MSSVTLAPPPRDEMTRYWDSGFLAAEARPGAFYDLKKLPAITQASHFRRMELLASLPLGDLTDAVCVDYGVGPWGFACVFPALHHCREAIGIDLSPEALRISESLSRAQTCAYGDRVRYLTSTGTVLDLPTASVDILFAGESIEHVCNVDAFLDEVHRVLKPNGRFVLTTPNADATLYYAQGERYCHNAEHVSLMTYTELRSLVDSRFDVVIAKGFNGSLYRTLDDAADDTFAERWTRAFEDRPDLATGVVLMATPKMNIRPRRVVETEFHHSDPGIQYAGSWQRCTLHGPLTAACAKEPGSRLTLTFEGDGLILFLWSDPWCGDVRVRLDATEMPVWPTASAVGGFVQRRWLELGPGRHTLELSADPESDSGSKGRNLMFWKAIAIERRSHEA
jgi:SAM-dependent methyltransferase